MPKYNGHKNWNAWNVSLWVFNDGPLYGLARDCLSEFPTRDAAARGFIEILRESGVRETPDGAPYTFASVRPCFSKDPWS